MDGQEVKLLCFTDRRVHFAVQTPTGGWYCSFRDLYGFGGSQWLHPLVEVPETKKLDVWLNVHSQHPCDIYVYSSKAIADSYAAPSRLACVHVVLDYKVGEGLS